MNGKSDFSIKIYGVRGSFPPTKGFSTNIGVNTTCLRANIGQHVVIFDAGTGIINLGADLISELKSGNSLQNLFNLNLFFSHTHIDHLMGFPYFAMLYMPQTELNIISPNILGYSIEEIIELWMSPALFPVTTAELPSRFSYFDFGENMHMYFFEDETKILPATEAATVENWIGRISCMRNFTHPKGGAYLYKVEKSNGESIVFATDIEGFVGGDQRLIKFAQNAKILIHDAQYTLAEYQMFQGFGHSTYEMACDVAKKAEVDKLILTHHDPKHEDKELTELENQAQEIFPQTFMAKDGMEFSF